MTKKIILGVITGLMFVGIYCTLNYMNEVRPTIARMDIYEDTANSDPCFAVKGYGVSHRIPEFGSQGYVIEKRGVGKNLEIIVTEDKCKINFVLRGSEELKDGNKNIKEHLVKYTKFTIDGKDIIIPPVSVSYSKPFNYSITGQRGNVFYVKANWHKYYTPEQLKSKRVANLLRLSLVVFLLVIIFYKTRKQLFASRVWQNCKKLQHFDLEKIITTKWQNISLLSKKAFLWIFLITNIVFLFHTVQYLWGDHDWLLTKYGMSTYNMLPVGRFTGGLIQQIFGGDLLPVINNIFCFAGFTFAVIYLAKYWKVPQTPLDYTLFGLFIILMPYTLSWLWYIKQTSLYWNIFFVIYALYISQNRTYLSSIIAVLLMVVSLGAYASVISTIAIVLLGRILMDVILEQKSVKELFQTYLRTVIHIVLSVVIFELILLYYDHIGKLSHGDYNTDYVSIAELPQNIKQVLQTSVGIFYTSQPYMSMFYKLLISLPILYVFYRMLKNKKSQAILGLLLLGIIILSGQVTDLMAQADFSYFVRVNFFSQPYIWALFIAIGLKGKSGIKSLCLIVMSVALWLNVLADVRYQKVHYLAFNAEMQIYNDVLTRIKRDGNFVPYKGYILVTTGPDTITQRENFYRYNKFKKGDYSLIGTSFSPQWDERGLYGFYNSQLQLQHYINLSRIPHINALSKDKLKYISDFISNKAQPYPHKNSVYVDDKYIFVIYDEKGLSNAERNIRLRLNELINN